MNTEKRLILAVTLSMIVLLSWSAFTSKTQLTVNKDVTDISAPSSLQSKPDVKPAEINVADAVESVPGKEFKFAQGNFDVVFDEKKASVLRVTFKKYQDYNFELYTGFGLDFGNLVFSLDSSTSDRVVFSAQGNNKRVIKRFIFSNVSYSMGLEVEYENISDGAIIIDAPLTLGELDFSKDPEWSRYQDVAIVDTEKEKHLDGRKDFSSKPIKFMGLRDRYFCLIVEPKENSSVGFIKKLTPQRTSVELVAQNINLQPGQKYLQKFDVYLGPQEYKLINNVKPDWSIIMNYGVFNFIGHILLQILALLYSLLHNWGLVIILLSVVIYFVLYPLSIKQMQSMRKMQLIGPQVEALKATYKDNPQRLNKEVLELYKKNKVNPFGGCLPLLLQIPIFFALYQVLVRAVSLKGSSFLWIKDLSQPDRLFIMPFSLPIIGSDFNILPILMAAGTLFQQKLSQVAASEEAKQQQKIMLIMFPIMMCFIFYKMPSGLVLYWFVNSALMLVNQLQIKAKNEQ